MKVFIDTNIWLYAFIQNQDLAKHQKANQLIQDHRIEIHVSIQVLNELIRNLKRKAHFSESQIRQLLMGLEAFCTIVSTTPKTLQLASQLRENDQLSFGIVFMSLMQ